jgi:hypothetical protein
MAAMAAIGSLSHTRGMPLIAHIAVGKQTSCIWSCSSLIPIMHQSHRFAMREILAPVRPGAMDDPALCASGSNVMEENEVSRASMMS